MLAGQCIDETVRRVTGTSLDDSDVVISDSD